MKKKSKKYKRYIRKQVKKMLQTEYLEQFEKITFELKKSLNIFETLSEKEQ